MTNQPAINQFLHLSPGAHVIFVNVWNCVGVARSDIATRSMMVGEGPVNQIKIEIIDLEVSQRIFASRNDFAFPMFIVPKLRGDPDLIAAQAFSEDSLEHAPDSVLIAINRRAIEMAIANGDSVADCISYRGMRDMVRSEGSETNGGNPRPGTPGSGGNA